MNSIKRCRFYAGSESFLWWTWFGIWGFSSVLFFLVTIGYDESEKTNHLFNQATLKISAW